jgi:predicted RecB family nuclease
MYVMLQRGGRLLLSPSDLNNFLACEHRTALDLARARGEILLQRIPRPEAELVAERGREHERAHLRRLRERGLEIVEIGPGEGAVEATVEAMKAGADVIHQATFTAGNWRGAADFLLKVRAASELGAHAYEPADAKLATHPKPYVIFQLLFYAAMVAQIQGVAPERVHVVLGTDEMRSFRPREFQAYADQVQGRFLLTLQGYRKGAQPPYPYPVEHCAYCDWWARCRDRRRADDHLSLVAGITRAQAIKLEQAGVRSVTELADVPSGVSVPGISAPTLAGLRQQAWLQVLSRDSDVPVHERLPGAPGRGFARLPPHSAGDVFFDIEGDPYFGPTAGEGLEYLFGSLTEDGYEPLWAHDREQERAAFERWVDWITARLERHPDLHVYHYNHYEPTALKALMSRYGTREAQVDDLLRRKVFVDLYTVVRQALRIGTESYSLKAVEAMYPFERDAEVTEAGGSILAYQEYLASRDESRLVAIADYNADDCRSTQGLRDWLLAERGSAGYHDVAPPSPPSEQQLARHAEVERLEEALLAGGEDPGKRLLADLLQYHRREARPEWWAYFDRLGRTAAELRDDDPEAIGDLLPADDVPLGEVAQSYLHPLRFPPQQHKLSPGIAVDPVTQRGYEIPRIDDAAGLVWLKRGKASLYKPLPTALIPPKPIPQTAQQAALRALAEQATGTLQGPSAAFELVLRVPPRLRGETLGKRVANLDGSALFIQGPPGSGKTYTGARLICDLLDAGKRVGVAATSHKAIANLLDEVECAAQETGTTFRGLKKSGGGNPESVYGSDHVASSADNAAFPPDGEVTLIAGTPWLWAREELRGSVDVLFVDEAGQMALADALAIAAAGRAMVLLGDPQQLAHVSQGTHPRGSGVSVLEHLLGDRETVPPGEGVFLERTWRMHPDVCRFVSRAMYEGRLQPVDGLERQAVASPGLCGAGVRLIEVEHAENRQCSDEEADRIAEELAKLLDGGRWTDANGEERDLTLEDILIVTPFNAQVRHLRDRLPHGARIGTVDKFQGQEAPVVFFSMAASSGEDVPRGMDFLFSRNRLNVAISRAQALAVVVCSPRLLWARCNSVEQMRLVNALCSFAEEAERQAAAAAAAPSG